MQVNASQPTSSSPYPASLHTVSAEMLYGSDSEFGSDLSDITDGNLSDISLDSDDSGADVFASMAPAEKAEYERFGFEYKGPKLSESEASRLLILMLHANGCPCQYVIVTCSVESQYYSPMHLLTHSSPLCLQTQKPQAQRCMQEHEVYDAPCARLSWDDVNF